MRCNPFPFLFACALALPTASQGGSFGPGTTVPAALRDAFGNTSFGYPFGQAPNRFQQVIEGSELRGALDIRGIALRKDDRIYSYQGRTVDVEIRLGHTTKNYQTLSNNFAANFDAGAPEVVLARRQHRLGDMPWNPPADPSEFFHEIPFDREFAFRGQGRNLLLEVVVFGNDVNNQSYLYPMDSGTGTTSSMLYGNGASATTGVVSPGHGLALRLLTPADRLAFLAHVLSPSGPAGRSNNRLTGGNPPLLGSVCTLDLYAPTYDVGAVLVSAGMRQLALPMQGYQLLVYTDLAQMVSLPVALTSGFGSLQIPLANNPAFKGIDLTLQGIVASRAQPALLGGTNLVLANLGTSLIGTAVFAMVFGPFGIAPNSYMRNPDGTNKVIFAGSPDSANKILIQGTKPSGVGPLEIRVTDPARTFIVPAGADTFSQEIDVSPGGQVFFFNADRVSSMGNVTYEITAVK